MAMNEPFDWRRSDRRLFAPAAIIFPIIVVIGFARTYYLKLAFGTPPLPSLLVHVHGIVMTLWVGFFISQVWLIRTRSHRTHMNMGMLGIALATVVVVVGFFTGVAGAKYPAASLPPEADPIQFFVVPFFDIFIFAGLFASAIIYRKRPADHKRLMLLTAVNFLPPAIGRFPFEPFISGGILVFFGIPTLIAILLVAFDTWRNRKLNVPFLAGTVIIIASYPLRILIMQTQTWNTFATWLTTWAA